MSEYTIEERVVKPEECNKFGKLINGVRRPAGFKYKVKIAKKKEAKNG